MFTLESRVAERVPAWVECDHQWCRDGQFEKYSDLVPEQPCFVCNGEGGNWQEAVWEGEEGRHFVEHDFVRKSSFLVRYHDVCKRCFGEGGFDHSYECHGQWIPEGEECDHCLKDADGKPTGCEPDTATQWEVL